MNVTINIVELASDLASYELEENWCQSVAIWEGGEDEECTNYTEEAQDIFDDLYDKYYAIIENTQIKP
jgi:hypothetical protein